MNLRGMAGEGNDGRGGGGTWCMKQKGGFTNPDSPPGMLFVFISFYFTNGLFLDTYLARDNDNNRVAEGGERAGW